MKALAAAYYLVTNYWRRPWALFLYVLVYWGRTLLIVLLVANWAIFTAAHFHGTSAGLATAAAAVAVASFNLGFGIRDVMPGPPPGKRR